MFGKIRIDKLIIEFKLLFHFGVKSNQTYLPAFKSLKYTKLLLKTEIQIYFVTKNDFDMEL